jgi:hypothetical protein
MSEHTKGKLLRQIRVEGDVAFVPLSRGYEAVIDASDVGLVEGFNWSADVSRHTVYAVRRDHSKGKSRSIRMHRALMGDPEGFEVDHKDCNGLNNRRQNLRVVTASQNKRNTRTPKHNTSGHKGVTLHVQTGKWHAQIQIGGKHISLGLHETKSDAYTAYCKASSAHHGEYGRVK